MPQAPIAVGCDVGWATSYARAGGIDSDPRVLGRFERLHALRVLSDLEVTGVADHPIRHLRAVAEQRLDIARFDDPAHS